MNKTDKLTLTILYVLLLFGALWHILGVFQEIMRWLTTPVMASVAILAAYGIYRNLPETKHASFLLWSSAVVVSTFVLEWLGVSTGVVFGEYAYSDQIQPRLVGVPVVIGLAWLGAICGAAGILRRTLKVAYLSEMLAALAIGALITLFDVALEPVAIRLNYWQWLGNDIPLQNYFMWFLAGSVLAYWANREQFLVHADHLSMHSYLAQLIYFLLLIAFL